MTAVAFDTLKFVRTLRDKANMSTEQAEGFAEAIVEAIDGDIATKTDVGTVKTELRQAELRLEARIEAAKAKTIKWVVSAIGFQTVVIVGAVVALSRQLH